MPLPLLLSCFRSLPLNPFINLQSLEYSPPVPIPFLCPGANSIHLCYIIRHYDLLAYRFRWHLALAGYRELTAISVLLTGEKSAGDEGADRVKNHDERRKPHLGSQQLGAAVRPGTGSAERGASLLPRLRAGKVQARDNSEQEAALLP